jgi:non-canonical poly(A) RNA polymerase PAPD5/7
MDPNNSANDISGGTGNIEVISRCFSQAYRDLQMEMAELHYASNMERRNRSILGTILGGNYSSFAEQRERLRRLYEMRSA